MKFIRPLALGLSLCSVAAASTSFAEQEHAPAITLDAARAIALGRVRGAVLSQEYEKEAGRWIYSFDIRPEGEKGKRILEVHVDGDTARILGIAHEKG